MADNSADNSPKRKSVGKPFVKGDPRINRAGAPKRGQTWQETVKRITDMTREELIEYVGAGTKLGKLLKELPPDVPLKDALVITSVIAYGRDPNPRLLATLMDREDGKPNQPISGKDGEPLIPKVDDELRSEILRKLDSIAAATGAGAVSKPTDGNRD
jgi:hypothetical protein